MAEKIERVHEQVKKQIEKVNATGKLAAHKHRKTNV